LARKVRVSGARGRCWRGSRNGEASAGARGKKRGVQVGWIEWERKTGNRPAGRLNQCDEKRNEKSEERRNGH